MMSEHKSSTNVTQLVLGVLAAGCIFFCSLHTARGLGDVTCKVSPETIAAGENCSLSFNFPNDVSQLTMVHVTVHRFPLKGSDPERVFECLKLYTPNLSCSTTSEGYSLEGDVKTSLTLRISDVSPEQSGRFFCSVMSPEREIPETEPCSLLVHDVLDVSATTTTEPAKPAVTTDLGGQGSDRNDGKTTTSRMIHIIFTPVMLLPIIIVTIYIILRRKSRRPDDPLMEEESAV